jgi:hypothetical protein
MFRVLSLGHPLPRTVLNTILELDQSCLKCVGHVGYRVFGTDCCPEMDPQQPRHLHEQRRS